MGDDGEDASGEGSPFPTDTYRLIVAIMNYAAKAIPHSELSTVYMLADDVLEAYCAERKKYKAAVLTVMNDSVKELNARLKK